MGERSGEITETVRGRRCVLGRGADRYVIVDLAPSGTSAGTSAGTPVGTRVVEEFPMGPGGWYRAWSRFQELESRADAPYALRSPYAPVGPDRPAGTGTGTPLGVDRGVVAYVGLLLAGVALGSSSLFWPYLGGTSLASQGYQLLGHVVYLAGWAAVAVLVLGSRTLTGAGAVFGIGLSVMAGSFYLVDVATALAVGGPAAGPGLYLALVGWLACGAGSLGAYSRLRSPAAAELAEPAAGSAWRLGRLGGRRRAILVGGGVTALGAAVTFGPPWDRYSLFAAGSGQSETLTAGNAFAQPGLIIAANVLVMCLMVVLVVVGLSRRRPVLGVALAAGAVLPLLAQLFGAIVQNATPPVPAAFGIGAGAAARAQLSITAGFTPWFYVFCGSVAVLTLLVAVAALESARSRSVTSGAESGPWSLSRSVRFS